MDDLQKLFLTWARILRSCPGLPPVPSPRPNLSPHYLVPKARSGWPEGLAWDHWCPGHPDSLSASHAAWLSIPVPFKRLPGQGGPEVLSCLPSLRGPCFPAIHTCAGSIRQLYVKELLSGQLQGRKLGEMDIFTACGLLWGKGILVFKTVLEEEKL